MSVVAVHNTTNAIMPVMRRDQAKEIFWIMGVVAAEKTIPPTPLPAAAIPCAKLLFLLNHCGSTGVAGNHVKPVPNLYAVSSA